MPASGGACVWSSLLAPSAAWHLLGKQEPALWFCLHRKPVPGRPQTLSHTCSGLFRGMPWWCLLPVVGCSLDDLQPLMPWIAVWMAAVPSVPCKGH